MILLSGTALIIFFYLIKIWCILVNKSEYDQDRYIFRLIMMDFYAEKHGHYPLK